MRRVWRLVLLVLIAVGGATAACASGVPEHIRSVEVSPPAPGSYAEPPPQVDAFALPSAWTPTRLPHFVRYDRSMGERSNIVSVWYRIRPAPSPTSPDAYLYIPRWRALGKIAIYADGRLIYAPRSSPTWNGFNQPIWTPLGKPGEATPREILIHINEVAGNNTAISSLWVGDKQALAPRVALRRFVQIEAPKFASEVLIVAGLVAVFIWLRRRNEPIYLLTFALSILLYAHGLQYWVGQDPLPITDGWFQWIEINSEIWWVTISFFLIVIYDGGGFVRTRWVVGGFATLFTAGTLLARGDVGLLRAALLPLWTGSVLALAPMIVITWMKYFQARTITGLLFASFATLAPITILHDIGMSRLLIGPEDIYWVPWFSVFQAMLILYASLYRYLRALDLAQSSEAELAARLALREQELSAIHERLRIVQEREVLATERQRLMRDMHDGVGSSLIGALAVIERGDVAADETAQMLRDCLDDLKLAIDSLEPNDGDLLLLLATARYRLEPRLEQAGIRLVWTVGDVPNMARMTPEHALHVLRIVQEVFTNIVKHAHAHEVRLSITSHEKVVIIAIADDGVGFDVAQAMAKAGPGPRRRGLANLAARAATIGASIDWTSTPGRTCVKIRIVG